jgi:hypothetical protein
VVLILVLTLKLKLLPSCILEYGDDLMIDHGCICLIIFSPLSIVKLAVQIIVTQFKATNTICQYYLTSPPFLYLTPLPSPSFSLSHTSSLSLLLSPYLALPHLPPSLRLVDRVKAVQAREASTLGAAFAPAVCVAVPLPLPVSVTAAMPEQKLKTKISKSD